MITSSAMEACVMFLAILKLIFIWMQMVINFRLDMNLNVLYLFIFTFKQTWLICVCLYICVMVFAFSFMFISHFFQRTQSNQRESKCSYLTQLEVANMCMRDKLLHGYNIFFICVMVYAFHYCHGIVLCLAVTLGT